MKRLAIALLLTATAATACGNKSDRDAGPNPDAVLRLTGPATGTAVRGNVVSLRVAAQGVRIVKANGDTSGRTAHFHVFIDRNPTAPGGVIPKTGDIVHTATTPIVVTGLPEGHHQIYVVLGDGEHRRLGRAVVHTSVHVKGPTLNASAPTTAKVGDPVTVHVATKGARLTPADGDTSGRSGHLHLFIDRDPTAAGQPIPKAADIIHTPATKIEIPAFTTPGEHTVWVVLGDGNHVPFQPRVMDKLTISVS
ncbi:MAG: DUF4399 domain-containing protein [Actinobacteria bacterium]|nr:DUF4399 domain-containing protein [Actinomycetota bacterium]